MHAVLRVVEFTSETSEEQALRGLRDQVIPAIEQAPGFVKGTWFGDSTGGHGLVLFETEEQANQEVAQKRPGPAGVRILSSEVYRVQAEA